METPDRKTKEKRVTFELVLEQLRKHNFAVLSTVDDAGAPHSAGVNYGLSKGDNGLAFYVMTRTHLRKTRNIARNPNVSLVVPIPRQLLWFLPPATIQLQGRAEILDGTDEAGTAVFRTFWMGRRILDAYQESRRRGETRICILKITPDPVIHSYMVGYSIWEIRKRMESGAARVVIPPEYRSAALLSPLDVGCAVALRLGLPMRTTEGTEGEKFRDNHQRRSGPDPRRADCDILVQSRGDACRHRRGLAHAARG